jgi:c-di-GMP-related signal transduction protein
MPIHSVVTFPRPAGDDGELVHIGRQAIYDLVGDVVGYELLFRAAADATASSRGSAYATSQVIVNAFSEFGLNQIAGNLPCFINVTREFLVGDLPLPFGPEQVVLEVLETVEVDDEVLAGVRSLVGRGFRIALDDYTGALGHDRLLDAADYVKLDMLDRDPQAVMSAVFMLRRRVRGETPIKLIAERIETPQMRDLALRFGFQFFQGHLFARPHTITASSVSPSRVRRLELFGALMAGEISMDQVAEIVTSDPALSVRVLRTTNSALPSLSKKISSVHEAIMTMGGDRIRQWLALMLVTDIAETTDEQLAMMMSRAKLCQTVAERLDVPTDAAFTVGLLAGVAEFVAEPLPELVKLLRVSPEIVEALLNGRGRLGQVLATVRAYEQRDGRALRDAPMPSAEMARAYLAAVGWSQETIDDLLGGRLTIRT